MGRRALQAMLVDTMDQACKDLKTDSPIMDQYQCGWGTMLSSSGVASGAITPPTSAGAAPAKEDQALLERTPSSATLAHVSEMLENPTCMDDKTRDQRWVHAVLPIAEDKSLEVCSDEAKLLNTGLSGPLSEFCLDSNLH